MKDKRQLKQTEAAVRISSNLYLHTFSSSDVLNFRYSDSRFRCMIFCLSTILKLCEDVITSSESVPNECLNFFADFTTSRDSVKEFFNQSAINPEQAEKSGAVYLNEYRQQWLTYDDAIKSGDKKWPMVYYVP